PEDPLVIGGSTASPRPRREGVEERAAGLDGPLRALTERPFELAHEVLRFSPCRVGARPAECALDELESRVDPARRPRRARRRPARRRAGPELEREGEGPGGLRPRPRARAGPR